MIRLSYRGYGQEAADPERVDQLLAYDATLQMQTLLKVRATYTGAINGIYGQSLHDALKTHACSGVWGESWRSTCRRQVDESGPTALAGQPLAEIAGSHWTQLSLSGIQRAWARWKNGLPQGQVEQPAEPGDEDEGDGGGPLPVPPQPTPPAPPAGEAESWASRNTGPLIAGGILLAGALGIGALAILGGRTPSGPALPPAWVTAPARRRPPSRPTTKRRPAKRRRTTKRSRSYRGYGCACGAVA